MAKLVPKSTTDESWKPLVQNRDYAVLCNPSDVIYFRFGLGLGMYISVDPTPSGRLVNSVAFETGDPSLLGKLPSDTKVLLGRTSDCAIKVMHAIISRQHLQFLLNGNVLVVRDLGSTNGTYIHSDIKHFDIQEYLESHPLDKASESTMDWVHEAFGVTIDDFLKNYAQDKGMN